jgi:hypothetical protein
MRKVFSVFFALFLMLPGAARADIPINAEGAEKLRGQVQEALQLQIDMAKVSGQGLAMEGKVEVTPKEGFYEIKMPGLSVRNKEEGWLDIGNVTLRATPEEAPGATPWRLEGSLPSTLTYYDATKAPVAQIRIGKQRISALWRPDLGIYPQMNSLLEKVEVRGTEKAAVKASIDSIRTRVDLKDNGDGTWTGPMEADISGIMLDASGETPLTLGVSKISSRTAYTRLDIRQRLEAQKEIEKLLKDTPLDDPAKKELLHKTTAKLLMQLRLVADETATTFTIEKARLRDKGDPAQKTPPKDAFLEKFFFASTTAGAQADKSSMKIRTGFEGLRLSFVPAVVADIVPHTMNAEVDIDNLPLRKITDLAFSTLKKTMEIPKAAQSAGETLVARQKEKAETQAMVAALPKMMQEAGTSVSVENTYLKSAAISTAVSGKLGADSAAKLGAVGKMTAVFRGLDEFIVKLQQDSLKSGGSPQTFGYLAGLSMLQSHGTPGKAADGTSLRNYVFEVTPEGKVLLNGTLLYPLPVPETKAPAAPAQEPPKNP